MKVITTTHHAEIDPSSRVELNFAAQDLSVNGILSNAELGLSLRYEIKSHFASYVGISWESKMNDSARFA
jgi:copper resistance protein B